MIVEQDIQDLLQLEIAIRYMEENRDRDFKQTLFSHAGGKIANITCCRINGNISLVVPYMFLNKTGFIISKQSNEQRQVVNELHRLMKYDRFIYDRPAESTRLKYSLTLVNSIIVIEFIKG